MGNKNSSIKEELSYDELLRRVKEYIDREYANVEGDNQGRLLLSVYENKYFSKYIKTSANYGDFCYRINLIEKIVKKFKKQFVLQIDYAGSERFHDIRGLIFTFTQPPRTTEEVIQFVKEHLEGLNRSMKYLKEHNFLYSENEQRMKEVEDLLKKAIEQHKIISAVRAPE